MREGTVHLHDRAGDDNTQRGGDENGDHLPRQDQTADDDVKNEEIKERGFDAPGKIQQRQQGGEIEAHLQKCEMQPVEWRPSLGQHGMRSMEHQVVEQYDGGQYPDGKNVEIEIGEQFADQQQNTHHQHDNIAQIDKPEIAPLQRSPELIVQNPFRYEADHVSPGVVGVDTGNGMANPILAIPAVNGVCRRPGASVLFRAVRSRRPVFQGTPLSAPLRFHQS
jgi:hypothetical protein